MPVPPLDQWIDGILRRPVLGPAPGYSGAWIVGHEEQGEFACGLQKLGDALRVGAYAYSGQFHSILSMSEGIELDIAVRKGTTDENFIAVATGNIAAFDLSRERKETLQWQILRIDEQGHHHFRLILRHPEKSLDIGLKHALETELKKLSSMDVEAVRKEYERCTKEGLKPSRLRHVSEHPDTWNDDFWNWLG